MRVPLASRLHYGCRHKPCGGAGIQVVSAGTSEAEIAAMMNLGSHGLTAGVYSADRDFARRILRQLDVGTVYATPIRCE